MLKIGKNNAQFEGCGMSLIEKSEGGGGISLICKPSAWRIQSKWLYQFKKYILLCPLIINWKTGIAVDWGKLSDEKSACFGIDFCVELDISGWLSSLNSWNLEIHHRMDHKVSRRGFRIGSNNIRLLLWTSFLI